MAFKSLLFVNYSYQEFVVHKSPKSRFCGDAGVLRRKVIDHFFVNRDMNIFNNSNQVKRCFIEAKKSDTRVS